MKNVLKRLWKEEDGAETAEWVVIVALLVVVALVVYNQILQGQLTDLVNSIGTKIDGLISGSGGTSTSTG